MTIDHVATIAQVAAIAQAALVVTTLPMLKRGAPRPAAYISGATSTCLLTLAVCLLYVGLFATAIILAISSIVWALITWRTYWEYLNNA